MTKTLAEFMAHDSILWYMVLPMAVTRAQSTFDLTVCVEMGFMRTFLRKQNAKPDVNSEVMFIIFPSYFGTFDI